MLISKKKLLTLSIPFALMLGGCAVGHSEFNCSEGSEEGICASASTIYKATNGELQEDETLTYFKDGERRRLDLQDFNMSHKGTSKIGVKGEVVSDDQVESRISHMTTRDLKNKAILNSKPVLKVWVAPWINRGNQLSMGEFIFSEVHEKTWNFGKDEAKADSYAPIFKPEPNNKGKK